MHWVLGLPDIFINTASDLALLPRVLGAATRVEARLLGVGVARQPRRAGGRWARGGRWPSR